MTKYDPKKIEAKWQKHWEKEQTFAVTEDKSKPKYYTLFEFPYPSGEGLHVGHNRPYTAMDIIARKKRMQGYNVLLPIGFDAFGLPTENFAIKTKQQPAVVTKKNIANFTRQLKALGYSFDWDRAVDTTDPKYYKWTQWLFLQFFKHGLAYKKNQPINWCPKDKIGLANEEVVNGCCERCGTPVEQRNKEQWMLAITKYAEKLLNGLNDVDYITPARVSQENWIGKSEGAEIKFLVRGQSEDHAVTVFTTRPDTLFGVTYLAVSAELAKSWLGMGWKPEQKVVDYIETTLKERAAATTREEVEKTGIAAGFNVVNPANNEEVPLWITNYVLGNVGTGAVMGVPAHDERDFAFAKKYKLPIKEVIEPETGEKKPNEQFRSSIVAIVEDPETKKFLTLNWGPQYGGTLFVGGGREGSEEAEVAARREIAEETGYANIELVSKTGRTHHHYFAFSKNVARNTEVVGLHFKLKNKEQTKTEHQADEKGKFKLEWLSKDEVLAKMEDENHLLTFSLLVLGEAYTGNGILKNSGKFDGMDSVEAKRKITEAVGGQMKTNYKLRDWVFSRQRYWGEPIPLVYCEACAKAKKFESKGEEMNPGWIPLEEKSLPLELPKVEKYEPTDTGESPLAAMTKWVETKCLRCGGKAKRETDTMPNWAGSSWYFLRYCDPHDDKAFASEKNLKYWMNIDWYNGGMEHTVLHLLYSRFWNIFLHDIGLVPMSEPYQKRTSHGMILASDGEKMSKSRGNVINPDEMIEQFGADALRTYIMFMGPFDQAVKWDTNGLIGVRRFLDKVWNLQEKVDKKYKDSDKATSLLHQVIKKVTEDIDTMRYNTAIAKMMEFVNELTKEEKISEQLFVTFVQILSPFAPHLAEELWATFGSKGDVAYSAWPKFDAKLAQSQSFTLAVQVNGKVRDTIEVEAEITEAQVKELVMKSEKVQKWLEGKAPKKVIYVKGKLVSIVV